MAICRRAGQPPRGRQDAGRQALRQQGLRHSTATSANCSPASDIDAVLIATGDRWHAPASILAAKAGKDVYSEKPCGITIAACQDLADTMQRDEARLPGRHAAPQRPQLPAGRRAGPQRQARQAAHAVRLGLHSRCSTTPGCPAEPTPPRDVVDWNLWLGPAPWRPYNQQYVRRRAGAATGTSIPAPRLLDWGAHTVDLCQWANKADDTMPIEYEPSATNITSRYANGVKLVLDFLKTPFGERPGWVQSAGHLPGAVRRRRGLGREPATAARSRSSPTSLQQRAQGRRGKPARGLDVSAHARNFFDCIKSRGQTGRQLRR